jgi:hypothetical protein
VAGALFAEGRAGLPRRDVTIPNFVGLAFSLLPIGTTYDPPSVDDVKAFASLDGTTVHLKLEKSLRLSLELGSLSEPGIKALAKHFTAEQSRKLASGLTPGLLSHSSTNKRAKLCVVTYANDADAWFPYFYKHYVELVGPQGIYVVTPMPELFNQYSLGGLITASNLEYDDTARAFSCRTWRPVYTHTTHGLWSVMWMSS